MAERTRLSERDAVFVTLPLESDGEGDEGDEGMGEKGVVFLSDRKDVGEAGPRLDGDDAIGFDNDAEEEEEEAAEERKVGKASQMEGTKYRLPTSAMSIGPVRADR